MRGEGFGAGDMLVSCAEERDRLIIFSQKVEGEDDVVGGDGTAILPFGRGIQVEYNKGMVVRDRGAFRNERIGGQRIVTRRYEELVVQQININPAAPLNR